MKESDKIEFKTGEDRRTRDLIQINANEILQFLGLVLCQNFVQKFINPRVGSRNSVESFCVVFEIEIRKINHL
jgi:hypothetical protein